MRRALLAETEAGMLPWNRMGIGLAAVPVDLAGKQPVAAVVRRVPLVLTDNQPGMAAVRHTRVQRGSRLQVVVGHAYFKWRSRVNIKIKHKWVPLKEIGKMVQGIIVLDVERTLMTRQRASACQQPQRLLGGAAGAKGIDIERTPVT
jgi:hypothetical protein